VTPQWLKRLSAERPVLIAGPTASGKSALALEIATTQGGVIVNADALQVFANWQILTARPGRDEEARAPHRLFGHVARDATYSVGQWLHDVTPLLDGNARAIIVGGTGLYFTSLTQGLADIPQIPTEIRTEADRIRETAGLAALLAGLDIATASRIDRQNPARVQRAWEVFRTTGRGLADWQADTPPPFLPADQAHCLLLDTDRDWLNERIASRFDAMIASGAIDEARRNLDHWNPACPSSKAIGANELIAYLRGSCSLAVATDAAKIATRQYAKRQRTWFRSKMRNWTPISLP